jgi:hypothetical protein
VRTYSSNALSWRGNDLRCDAAVTIATGILNSDVKETASGAPRRVFGAAADLITQKRKPANV